MARINWGITNGFIGKLGNVVGFNWKGMNVQRALTRVSNPRSKAQMLHRAKFALNGKLSRALYGAMYVGFKMEARGSRRTQTSLFIKGNKDFIVGSAIEALSISYENLKLSTGAISGVAFGEMSVNEGVMSVNVTNEALIGHRVSVKDKIFVCLFCPEKAESVCGPVGVRTDTSVTMQVPASWGNRKVYVYGFCVGAEQDNMEESSETVFIGSFGEGQITSANEDIPAGNTNETPAATVNAPVISGTTPFEETTEVSISGPDGAQIYYTTNGGTPTSASTLYSAAFTLNDTATVKAVAIKDGVYSEVVSKLFAKTSGNGGDDGDDH